MVNRRFYHKILIIVLIFAIFTSSCFASTTSNMIDGMKNLSTIDEIYNYIKTTFGSDGSNVTNSFLNGILQAINNRLRTVQNIVWVDFATRNIHGIPGDLSDYMYRDSNTQTSIYSKLNEFYNRYYSYSDGNASLLNQINNNTTNMYGSQSATNVHLAALRDELKNIEWLTAPWQFQYYSTPSGYKPSTDTQISYTSYPRLYIKFGGGTLNGQNLYRVTIPVTAYANDNKNNYIESVALYRDNVLLSSENIDFYVAPGTSYVYLYFKTLPQYGFNIAITFKNNYIIGSTNPIIQYVPIDTLDYYLVSYLGSLNSIYESNKDIVDAINNFDANITVNPEVSVDINNTITDNDLTLDVDLPDNANNDTSNLLNKLKHLMLTGITTNQLLNALDDVELNAWYSQSNKNVVEALNNQYTNLYD